ncbi:MAG: hypothetical protein JKX70_08130 [Phycisphaerales bacterium]|nr:hypothetical protein [Phycisphaerales bacterium]
MNPEQDPVNPDTLELTKSYVTLVEENAQYMLVFETNHERTSAVNQSWNVDEPVPQAPAGTYYIATGMYGSDETVALRRSIVDGRQNLLVAAGVQKITLLEGQLAIVVLNATNNKNAILQVGSDLLD